MARNIILLLTALLSAKPEDAATRMIHIWYSASIRQSDLEFLHGVVRPNIESVCSNLEGEDLDRLHSGTFSRGSYSWVNVVLPKKSWLALLKYLQVPEGLTIDQARQVRTAVTLPAGHLDFIEHNYFPLLPAQRICWHRFRLDGVLLPFGASRKPFDTPNPLVNPPLLPKVILIRAMLLEHCSIAPTGRTEVICSLSTDGTLVKSSRCRLEQLPWTTMGSSSTIFKRSLLSFAEI